MSSTPQGYCCLVLHSHLPYIHHPEFDDFLEEDWLFEAMTETYLPLLGAFEDLERDGIATRLALTVTPPLLEMLDTPDLGEKFERYLDYRTRLVAIEVERYDADDPRRRAAEHYRQRFARVRDIYDACNRDIVAALRGLQERGLIELVASSATHAFLPLLAEENAVRAQIEIGVDRYRQAFGVAPKGFWLPECAYRPGIEDRLAEAGIEWTVLDSHGVKSASPAPPTAAFRPVMLGGRVAAFGRDAECSQQVWSSVVGYPGDPAYRELYRDLGYDADYLHIRPFLKPDGVRRQLGIKYHRITGEVELDQKELWDPDLAFDRARVHAGNFVFNRSEQIKHQLDLLGESPVVTAPFDTELFGHWWYEGPVFIEAVFREAHAAGAELPFAFATPSEVLAADGHRPRVFAQHSTWGENGFSHVWLNESNQWLWPHVHEMERRMVDRAQRHVDPDPAQRRLLDQMGRELLLAESSDWAFILTKDTSAHYAERRVRDHVHRFLALERALDGEDYDAGDLGRVEANDAVFPDLDFRRWA